ncbi:MAG: hypothetical protein KJN60_03725 [Boseongicola sp.]|nr:hypothetical protein [Boseongicola sp.]
MLETVAKTHRSREELEAALPHISAAPKDDAEIALIVVRPDHGLRKTPEVIGISRKLGVEGDHWSKDCWLKTEDGAPHPDVQINLMSARAAEAIAGDKANWPAAGNNFFVDLDLSPSNLPPGTRITLGSAEVEITDEPNKGCQLFIDRYGRDACIFVNFGQGFELRARGLYARVLKDGEVRVGDRVRKVSG